MPEINLLQNQLKDTTLSAKKRTRGFVVFCLFLLFAIAAASVLIHLQTQRINNRVAEVTADNQRIVALLSGENEELTAAKAYQAQLGNLDLLLTNHVYLTPLFEEIEEFTYQSAKFTTIDIAQETGKIHLEGTVSSYENMGKLLLGLSTSPHFNNVKLLNVAAGGEDDEYTFSVDMRVNTQLFSINQN